MEIMQDSEQLPSGLQDLIDEMKEAQYAKIDAIGKEVSKKRDEAVKGRRQSGIETIWEEDEEYYQGVDDANHDSHPWTKSASSTGGISRTPVKSSKRCTAFFNITRQFVDSASARMGDILLPAGDWNFALKPTPVQDDSVVPQNPAVQGQTSDPQLAAQAKADETAEKAETKLRDWLVECQYHTEVRKVIESAARLGTGVLKGPFPEKIMLRKATEANGKVAMEVVEDTSPASKYVDVWDFFPDPACGDNIHAGNYVLERDRITSRQLKGLKGLPGYLSDQIDKVLEEGPSKKETEAKQKSDVNIEDDDKYEIWYYYGLINVDGLSAMKVKIAENDSDKKQLPAIVTIVNETPIKSFINPLDTGEYPYDVMPWQSMAGCPWGVGVARQGRTPQDMINGAARALMDNAGLSSGPMVVIRKGAITPADGEWAITARKVWYATEQADIRSVADAILAINIPMVQAELSAIIQLAYKMMEDATGMAYLLQGQQGSAPDTVGGMELLHRNASAILRRLARVFDERVTEPHIRRYYEYLLLHGPDDCKGDLKVEAIGSTALVEREIQALEAFQLLQASLNPAFGLDPEKAMTEILKCKRMIPEKWKMDEAQKKARQNQQAPIPAIEVAKINSAQRSEQVKMELAHDEWKAKLSTNVSLKEHAEDKARDTIYNATMSERVQTDAQIRTQELQIKRDLAMLEYANQKNISLDKIKADLARESMRLRTQKELAGVALAEKHVVPQVAPTDMEPAGQAEPGRAFEQ